MVCPKLAITFQRHPTDFMLSKVLLPPQGFRPEAKSRGGTLVARAYIKDSTYSTNIQSVYRKNLDLLEQGSRGIGR